MLFLLYHAFSLFIVGGSSHLVPEHFLGLAGWNFCHFFFFDSASWRCDYSNSSSLHRYYSFGLGNKPYLLNCGKYLGIALKLIVRTQEYHRNPEVAGH